MKFAAKPCNIVHYTLSMLGNQKSKFVVSKSAPF